MTVRILMMALVVLLPTLAKAIDVPEGETARRAWCGEYVTLMEPRKPKFMSGSSLNQEFWRNSTPEPVRRKQAAEYEAGVRKLKEDVAHNNERIRICNEWGYKSN